MTYNAITADRDLKIMDNIPEGYQAEYNRQYEGDEDVETSQELPDEDNRVDDAE